MAIYADEVVRFSLPAIRLTCWPRDFRKADSVTIRHGDVRAVVGLVRVSSVGTRSGVRVWMRCPSCDEVVGTVGFHDRRWGCRRCLGWRARNQRICQASAPGAAGGLHGFPGEVAPQQGVTE